MGPSGPPGSCALDKPDEVEVFVGSVLSGEGSEGGGELSAARKQTAEATLSILRCRSATAGQQHCGQLIRAHMCT